MIQFSYKIKQGKLMHRNRQYIHLQFKLFFNFKIRIMILDKALMPAAGEQQIEVVQSSESSSAYTERGFERVGALEQHFEMKERASVYNQQHKNGQSVPLLLKPNGAPVFSNKGAGAEDLGQTMKRGQPGATGAANDLERTVKAHSFVVGKPTQNRTDITVLDVQKTSAAEDQVFPVKVLYVKPSMVKHRPKTAQQDDSQKRAIPRPKAAWQADQTLQNFNGDLDSQLDNEVSMGEVSGIFKHDRVPVKLPKPRKGASADQIAKAERLQAQKQYAKEVRAQASIKAKEQELIRKQKEKSTTRDQKESEEVPAEQDPELAATVKKRMPHSENRYQGQYGSMTAELFRRAQQKLLKEKQDEQLTKEEQKAKREKEKKYLEDIKQRNIEILKYQRETGNSLPPGGLKQKEKMQKEMQHQLQIKEDNEKRKELRQKRLSEGRAALGLDQADRRKMVQLARQKERQQQDREQERRAKERVAREQARRVEAQREAARVKLNKDLIDFTDPTAAPKASMEAKSARQETPEEDDEAVPMEDRKAVLAEQREKRRIRERIKLEQELEEKMRKENQMRQLEATLRQQRMDIARKQQVAVERQAQKAKEQKQKRLDAMKDQGQRKDQPTQLNELRDWIEEQMKIEEQRTKQASVARSGSQLSQGAAKPRTLEHSSLPDDNQPKDPILTGYQLPGNHMLPLDQERLVGVRQNRYGTQGDNGFGDLAAVQAEREGYDLKLNQKEDILDFEQPEASPVRSDKRSEESYDMKPVKQANQKRVIINRPQKEEESPAVAAPPGVINIQEEAARQKAEMDKRRNTAATAIQRRVRGWQDRKRTNKLKNRMRKDIDDDRADFIQHWKMNDKYNINRYMKEKERLRKLNKTDKMEESISENIQSSGQVDGITDSFGRSAPAGSYDQSKQMPVLQNLLGRPMRATERDPLSLIALLAKKKAALEPPAKGPDRDRSKSGPKMEKRTQRHQQEKKLQMSAGKRGSAKKKKPSYIDEEIEEDLPKSSNEKDDDQYSSDFQSEHISESLPSYGGSSKSKRKEAKSSSEIQESIQESIAQASVAKKDLKPGKMASGTYSIPEEVQDQKEDSIEESIVDEVDPVAESKDADEISEESHLQDSRQMSGSVRRPKVPEAQPLPKKVDRIREAIVHDFENDGAVPLAGSLKAQKLREQQEKLAKEQEQKYRMSRQIIDDFEAKQGIGSEEHQRLVKGLAEELQRYEAAVSGSIFVEQFQSIVQKSLAQRDMMMLGQRLAQMEAEKKHQQEIADIRAEQIKMMSQLMLLQAGTGAGGQQPADPNLLKQQQEIMKNIQTLVEKPIIIQREPEHVPAPAPAPASDPVEESHMSRRSRDPLRQSAQIQQSMKYTSMTASQLKDSQIRERRSQIEESGQIDDDIGSVAASDEDSIGESINMEQSQSQQLSAARRYLGSEKAVQDKSKAVISKPSTDYKAKPGASVFENNSFQNYTSNKFKDLLGNDGSQMDVFLDQIEAAITKKSELERTQLRKQLDSNQISQKTFQQKSKDLEKWVSHERKEIGQKRAKVQDTYSEIGQFLNKLEKDKNLILDKLSNQSTPRAGLRRSPSQLSASNSLKDVRDQIREIQEGKIGGAQPETKYLNKKREYVRQLMQEKKDAIERGVKEKMRDLESDMIDEAMQMALNLDVDKEVEKRVAAAREIVAEGKLEESRKTQDIEESRKSSVIDESRRSSLPKDKQSQKQGGKKAVKFHSPTPKDPSTSSYHSAAKKDLEKSGKADSIAEDIADDIDESININESFQPSSASASKVRQSAEYSGSKISTSKKVSEKIPEQADEEDSINSRIESDMEGSYTNDFASASIQSEKGFAQSSKALQGKAADIEESGYTDAFEEASVSQSAQLKKSQKGDKDAAAPIEPVREEEDSSSKEEKESSRHSEQKRESMKSKKSPGKKPKPEERQRMPSISDITDREIMESTMSVEWQINLQQRVASSYASEHDEAAPGEEVPGEPSEEQIESSIQEEESSEKTQEAGKGLDDLDSYPSASLSKSNEQEFQMRVDNITEQLLGEILKEFEDDPAVRLEVEDNFTEEAFEEKWPFAEAKKPVEEKPIVPSLSTKSEEEKKSEEKQDDEAKRKHDEAMKKYHEEQAALAAHHKKVTEYLDFMIEIVDKEVLMQALSKPIQHDPLRVLEKIQAFDTEDEGEQFSKQNISTYSQVFEPYLFDEIDRQWEELHQKSVQGDGEKELESEKGWTSKELRNVHHMAIFDAFNEALDLERPYKTKGLPNPWSKQTRVTHAALTTEQVDQIIKRARDRVIEWDKTGAGTKFAPPPPPPPAQGEYDSPPPLANQHESEEERNKAERQERLGLLLTKEVHQKENDWLDYEYEDTQVRFDLADMILEELADEVTQFLVENAEARGQILDYY